MRQARVGMAMFAALVASGSLTPASAAPNKADLIVTDVFADRTAQGQQMTLGSTVENIGTKAAGRTKTLYLLSENARPDGDQVLGTSSVPRIAAGSSASSGTSFGIPSSTPVGKYRVIACADARDKVVEKREANNCGVSRAVRVTDGVAPPPPSLNPLPAADDLTPTISGFAENLATVIVFGNNNCFPQGQIDDTTADDLAGEFSLDVNVPNGSTFTFTALAVDTAGNISECSAPVTYAELAAESEPNNDFANATPVPFTHSTMYGAISPSNDIDKFKVTVPSSGSTIDAETTDPPGTCATADTVMTLYDASGEFLTFDDNSGAGNCSRIDSNAGQLAAGTYYLELIAFGGSIPEYRLRVDITPP